MAETFPFAPEPEPGPGETGRSRKALLVVASGVVALGLLGYFVVFPALTGGSVAVQTPIATAPRAPRKKAPTKKAVVKPAAKPTTTTVYRDAIARDPFKVLWFKPEAVTAPTEVTGLPPAYPTTPTGTTGTSGTSTSSSTVGGQRVALVDVFVKDGKSYAQTRVGDTVYTPVVGSTFGGAYKLLATGNGTATYLYGDEQFSLREGQEVLK